MGEWKYSSILESASRPGRFTLWEMAPGTHWKGGCVGSRAGLDAVDKSTQSYRARNRTRAVQPVVHLLYRLKYSDSLSYIVLSFNNI
jgi:hypothetical protein